MEPGEPTFRRDNEKFIRLVTEMTMKLTAHSEIRHGYRVVNSAIRNSSGIIYYMS
jgi:hypothetical protein